MEIVLENLGTSDENQARAENLAPRKELAEAMRMLERAQLYNFGALERLVKLNAIRKVKRH